MIRIFAALLLLTFAASAFAESQKQILEETKNAPRIHPLSEESKDLLDKAADEATAHPDAEETSPKSLISTDCKTWKSLEDFSKGHKAMPEMGVFYKEGELTGYYNDKRQTLITASQEISFLKLFNTAAIAFIGKNGFTYQPVVEGAIHKDLMGIMQTLALVGLQALEGWRFSLQDSGKLMLSYIIPKRMISNPLLQNYLAIRCKPGSECEVVGNKSASARITKLKTGLEPYLSLKAEGVFKKDQFAVFDEACTKLAKPDLVIAFQDNLKKFKTTCSLQKVEEPNLELLKSACKDWSKTMKPSLKKFIDQE